jgi:hypothetical protein
VGVGLVCIFALDCDSAGRLYKRFSGRVDSSALVGTWRKVDGDYYDTILKTHRHKCDGRPITFASNGTFVEGFPTSETSDADPALVDRITNILASVPGTWATGQGTLILTRYPKRQHEAAELAGFPRYQGPSLADSTDEIRSFTLDGDILKTVWTIPDGPSSGSTTTNTYVRVPGSS